jgi:hypothetical protein
MEKKIQFWWLLSCSKFNLLITYFIYSQKYVIYKILIEYSSKKQEKNDFKNNVIYITFKQYNLNISRRISSYEYIKS